GVIAGLRNCVGVGYHRLAIGSDMVPVPEQLQDSHAAGGGERPIASKSIVVNGNRIRVSLEPDLIGNLLDSLGDLFNAGKSGWQQRVLARRKKGSLLECDHQ